MQSARFLYYLFVKACYFQGNLRETYLVGKKTEDLNETQTQ